MLTISAFDWRKLSPLAKVAYRLDETGALLVRSDTPGAPPFTLARVRDGQGGFVTRPIASLGFVWAPSSTDPDGWILRTHGEPTTMTHVLGRWLDLVRQATSGTHVDERIVCTLIANESGGPAPDADGHVKAPRTERGYPSRTGERDPGDFARDLIDWQASRGAHSSHGLMQTLIGTAHAARPDLFAGVDPAHYRTVLWDPAASIACGVAYLAGFPPEQLADPLAAQAHYGAGSVRAEANMWGAHVYDDLVMLWFLARWNDGAAVRADPGPGPDPNPQPDPAQENRALWATLAVAAFALAAVATVYAARHAEASRREAA